MLGEDWRHLVIVSPRGKVVHLVDLWGDRGMTLCGRRWKLASGGFVGSRLCLACAGVVLGRGFKMECTVALVLWADRELSEVVGDAVV